VAWMRDEIAGHTLATCCERPPTEAALKHDCFWFRLQPWGDWLAISSSVVRCAGDYISCKPASSDGYEVFCRTG
jgi:hypothetical protein